MTQFPIDAVMPELIDTLRRSPSLIVKAQPGAGKTTRVPPALLASGLLGDGQLVILEPRRVAARSAASFMAAQLGEPVGKTVGYRIRYDHVESKDTRILVMTEGILTRRFASDPFLEGVSAVVLDEFHERSVHLDLCLSFVKELQRVRDDLKLVVMSATLDTERLSRWLGNCPVIDAPGRMFPLTVSNEEKEDARPLEVRAAVAVRELLQRNKEGDVLVFMPGAREIHKTIDALAQMSLPEQPLLLPLYSALSSDQQDLALNPSSKRRVIVATNIAETSLTIPGVTIVVDGGLQRQIRWHPSVGLDRLETVAISRNSAVQRAGRAGRTAPGEVRRLWTAHAERGRREADLPEIQRVDPLPALLQILHFHPGDPAAFDFYDRPPEPLVNAGISALRLIGAVEERTFTLTPLGRELSSLPLHPRLGAIVLRAVQEGCPSLGISLAALLDDEDILSRPSPGIPAIEVTCDLEHRLELLANFEKTGARPEAASRLGLRFSAASRVLKGREQLRRMFRQKEKDKTISTGRLLLAGFPDRVCAKNAAAEPHGVMVGGFGVTIDPSCGVKTAPLFVAIEAEAVARGAQSRSKVTLASAISEADLRAVFPGQLHDRVIARFVPEKQLVVGLSQRVFGDLVLSSKTGATVSDEAACAVLVEAAIAAFPTVYKPDGDALALFARIRFASRLRPEVSWPAVDEDAHKARLSQLAFGLRSFVQLEKLDWAAAISDELSHEARTVLNADFPSHVTAPTGNRHRIDYEEGLKAGMTPAVSVRLQELFGMKETPRIGRGQLPLTFSLLAPNMRPVQVTRDLASFWKNTYPEVRKELRARYPKHSWPDDPLTAPPTSRPQRRKPS